MEYGQENSEFDHGREQVIPVGKEKDQEVEVEVEVEVGVEVDNLIRTNSKKQQQQQVGVGENDILNLVASAVHHDQKEEELNTYKAANEDDENPELEEDESSLSSDQKSVCFDETQGAVSSNGTNETSDQIGSPSAELSTAGKAPTKDELEQTCLHVDNLAENVKLVGEVKESNKEEVIDQWDVERVIEEQDTHDLICPNCKACITKRVILRKRKRSAPIIEIDIRVPKKSGTDPSTSSSNIQGRCAAEPGAPDMINERRNDVFRCFSCLSFFIPTVAGFRLFRCFGFGNEESILIPQTTPSPNQIGEVTPVGKRTANADDANELIQSLATTFPFVEPAHGNDQVKDAIGKIEVAQIQRDTIENHKNVRKDTNGGKLCGYSDSSEEVDGKCIATLSENDSLLLRDRRHGIGRAEAVPPIKSIAGGNVILDIVDVPIGSADSPSVQLGIVPSAPLVPPARRTESLANDQQGGVAAARPREWDILKSIVYGGLVEAIGSLGVVSSAAGADASTLNIVALGTASLVSGLLVIIHALGELKSDQHERVAEAEDEEFDRYEELLGRRHNFPRHATFVVLSYLVFGLLPPITYGFSFCNSNNKDYKILSVAAVSLMSIILLAIGKEHTRRRQPRGNSSYVKTTLYFVSIGLAASGLSFVLGEVVKESLEKFAVLEPNAAFSPPPPSSSSFLLGGTIPSMAESSAWASY